MVIAGLPETVPKRCRVQIILIRDLIVYKNFRQKLAYMELAQKFLSAHVANTVEVN